MFDERHALISKDFIDVYQFGVTSIRHSMVTDKNNIHNLCQVSIDKFCVQVLRKSINVFQRFL